jgi:RNA polymerase sigma-70 factor (ECF subfamily)
LANRLVVRVRRASLSLMRGSVDADDAAQHALIEILRSAHTYRGDASVERWADRVTSRSVIRFARAVRRRNQAVEPGLDAEHVIADAVDLSAREGVARGIEQYLSMLPDARREVLLLRHAFGHSIEEIAELTQASPNTVKDRLLAARRDLRKLIQRDRAIGAKRGGHP